MYPELFLGKKSYSFFKMNFCKLHHQKNSSINLILQIYTRVLLFLTLLKM